MVSFPPHIWLILAGIGFGALIAFLHMVATLVRNEVHLHDLQVEVATLRRRYFEQMRKAEQGMLDDDESSDGSAADAEVEPPIPMPGEPRPAAQAA